MKIAAFVAILVGMGSLAACSHEAENCEDLGSCPPDASAPNNACQGTCLPGPPSFGGPYVVWMGETAPPSDPCARPQLQDFFAGSTPPPAKVCPACTCSASTGSCALPATITANADACPGAGASDLFGAPNGWEGSCTPLPAAAAAGGFESVTVAPVVLTDGPCTPQQVTEAKPPPPGPQPGAWAYVHACESTTGITTETCSNKAEVCELALPALPGAPPSALWTYCVTSEAAQGCPTEYPIEHDFGNGYTGTQTCADCTCGTPAGSSCSQSLVTFYADEGCTTANEVGAIEAQTSMSMCLGVPATSPLGSMTAPPSVYTPGMCAAGGGGVVGDPPTPAVAMTFCCQE